jgi:hypothetical protein
MRTSELLGAELDWAVARCEGGVGENQLLVHGMHLQPTGRKVGRLLSVRSWMCFVRAMCGMRAQATDTPMKSGQAQRHS